MRRRDEASVKIYDITRVLRPTTAVWPGDQEVQVTWNARIGVGGSTVNLGAVRMSLHAGSHVDAPLHYIKGGDPVHKNPLLHFIGTCKLVNVPERETSITRDFLDQQNFEGVRRLLFKTPHSNLPDTQWQSDFVFFEPAAIDYMSERGIVLIGTDAPSVDPFSSKALPAHKALARCGIINLENLTFAGVLPGVYELIALPLKVEDMDAAPVRAILRDI